MTKQQLIEQKENLKKKLDEIQKQLDRLDAEVYGGKMAKAIKLLLECLDYLNCSVVSLHCPDCGITEFGLEEIIEGLERLYKEEF